MNVVQERNDELVTILASDFVRRQESTYAWKGACSMIQMFPGLRGSWPSSVVDASGFMQDVSGHGNHVDSIASQPDFGADGLMPYVEQDGNDVCISSDRADYDITGNEAFMLGASQGLTLGGVFRLDVLQESGLITKWLDTGNQRSYALIYSNANSAFEFQISSDGTAGGVIVVTSSITPVVNTWYFVVGRYDAGAADDMYIYVAALDALLTRDVESTGPTGVHSGSAPLEFGVFRNGGNNYLNGDESLMFLCGADIQDVVVGALFQHVRTITRA